jgi:hypothetical protein
MAKKRMTQEKATPQPQPGAVAPGGIVVTGGIHAGRDVIMGDQYNDLRQQVAQIGTPAEFVAQVQALQAQLAALKRQPGLLPAQVQTLEVVEGNIREAVEEAQKPEPLAARITATLTGASAVMDSLSKGVQAAVGLGTVLAGLAHIALRLFGG